MKAVELAGVALCVAMLFAPAPVWATGAANASSPLPGDRILVVTTDRKAADDLSRILVELYQAKVAVKDPADYAPRVDAYAYDGLVYYGANYFAVPKPGLVEDVERTAKPVLWINYHGWLLDRRFLAGHGISIFDEHSMTVDTLLWEGERIEIPETDVTRVDAPGESVLYQLQSNEDVDVPGSVHAGNFTYVSYRPEMDVFSDAFAPFLEAVRSAFGDGIPPEAPVRPDFESRLRQAEQDRFRTGVHLPVYVSRTTDKAIGYGADQWHDNLLRIKRSGAEWVNIVRTYYQQDLRATKVYTDHQLTPTLSSLRNIIRDAHALGLLVRMHVAINLTERRPLEWHGMISPSERSQWWRSYGSQVLRMAAFARRHEVESFVIGTELTSMESDSTQWRELVTDIRSRAGYEGLVGYAINYNGLELEWAEVLDFLSISAYWPLADDRDPDLATLNASWRRIGQQLRALVSHMPEVPIEFGEVGYASQPYSSVLPFSWKSHRGRQQDLNEQLKSYQALYAFLKGAEYVAGVHFFASTDDDLEPDSIGYTPFGKPAERVMEKIVNLR